MKKRPFLFTLLVSLLFALLNVSGSVGGGTVINQPEKQAQADRIAAQTGAKAKNHSHSPDGEIKALIQPGVVPTETKKVTIIGGPKGGCVLKKGGC